MALLWDGLGRVRVSENVVPRDGVEICEGGNCLSVIWFVGVLALAASASLGCGCWVASVGVDVA